LEILLPPQQGFLKMEVIKFKFTPENIDQFYAYDWRKDTDEFKKDVQVLVKKMVDYQKGIKNELTKRYPGRYDLTVFTYSQNVESAPHLINDGSHRLEALKIIFQNKLLKNFDAYLIPSNILGAITKEEAYTLNRIVNKELDKYGLPHWVKKFDFEDRDGKLIAWKNINLIDTGGKDTRKQYGIKWFLNEDKQNADDTDQHNYKNKYAL